MKVPKAKIYGVPKGKKKAVLLSELSFLATEKDVRGISKFLAQVADTMKAHGAKFGHAHLQDEVTKWPEGATDIIVVRDASKKSRG
jgi:hypothetical protein